MSPCGAYHSPTRGREESADLGIEAARLIPPPLTISPLIAAPARRSAAPRTLASPTAATDPRPPDPARQRFLGTSETERYSKNVHPRPGDPGNSWVTNSRDRPSTFHGAETRSLAPGEENRWPVKARTRAERSRSRQKSRRNPRSTAAAKPDPETPEPCRSDELRVFAIRLAFPAEIKIAISSLQRLSRLLNVCSVF